MKKSNLFMSGLVSAALLCSSTTVFAEDIIVNDKSIVHTVKSEFDVDENLIGNDLTVSIPANLVLNYDEEADKFICNEKISARGIIDSTKNLEISVADTITYTNTDSPDITVTGSVEFGTDSVEVWTAEQVAASNDVLDSRDITISVNRDDLKYLGAYTSELVFNFELVDIAQ